VHLAVRALPGSYAIVNDAFETDVLRADRARCPQRKRGITDGFANAIPHSLSRRIPGFHHRAIGDGIVRATRRG
jgi:hypothetical protein